MQREILFRAQEVGTKKWVYGSYQFYQYKMLDGDDVQEHRIYYFDGHRQYYVRVIPKTVSQYTGLTDKNGVKVFEGDFVNFGTMDKFLVEYKTYRDVTYGHGDSGEDMIVGFHVGSSYGTGNEPVVIGNFYDNPDLLEA